MKKNDKKSDDFGLNGLNDIDEADGDGKTKRKRWPLYVIIGVAVVVFAVIVAAGVMAATHKQGKVVDNSTVSNSLSKGGDSDTENSSKPAVNLLDHAGVPEFYQKAESKMTDDDKTSAKAYAQSFAPENAATALTQSSSGSVYNKDGSLNPDFSYLTEDNVIPQVMDDVQRIINPVYGGWSDLQSPTFDDEAATNAVSPFADMFSKDKATAIGNAKDSGTLSQLVPLYADWGRNAYNGLSYGVSPLQIPGVVNGQLSCNFNIQGMDTDTIDCSIPVKYVYHYTDDNKPDHVEYRTLKLSYRPDYNSESATGRVILLDSLQQQ